MGLKEEIKKAKSEKAVQKLVKESEGYKDISPKTLRKIQKEAEIKIKSFQVEPTEKPKKTKKAKTD